MYIPPLPLALNHCRYRHMFYRVACLFIIYTKTDDHSHGLKLLQNVTICGWTIHFNCFVDGCDNSSLLDHPPYLPGQ